MRWTSIGPNPEHHMSRARIVRYGRLRANFNTNPDVEVLICVGKAESIDDVADEVFGDGGWDAITTMLKQGRARYVMKPHSKAEKAIEYFVIPQESIDDDVLCRFIYKSPSCVFQPIDKELIPW